MQTMHQENRVDLTWPAEGATRVPYRVFFDPAIYQLEQEKLFRGPVWNYSRSGRKGCDQSGQPGDRDRDSWVLAVLSRADGIQLTAARGGRLW